MSLKGIIKKLYWTTKSPEEYARHLGVKIGHHTSISTRNWSSEPYLISIGNHVQVTQDVWFHTHGGAHVARRKYSGFDTFGKIRIEDWVYIGASSHILPGVTIGCGSLIASGSIVSKSVPCGEVWGGVPARFICTVEDYINRNLPYNLDCKSLTKEEKRSLLLSLPEEKFIKK